MIQTKEDEEHEVCIHLTEEARRLLKENDFEILDLYGEHDGELFVDCSGMMVIATCKA